MKKQVTILGFIFSCLFVVSQDRFVKTSIPCDKELLKKQKDR
jgi:hypothetical protein